MFMRSEVLVLKVALARVRVKSAQMTARGIIPVVALPNTGMWAVVKPPAEVVRARNAQRVVPVFLIINQQPGPGEKVSLPVLSANLNHETTGGDSIWLQRFLAGAIPEKSGLRIYPP